MDLALVEPKLTLQCFYSGVQEDDTTTTQVDGQDESQSDRKMRSEQRISQDIAVNSRIRMDTVVILMDIVRMTIQKLILRTPLKQLPTAQEKRQMKARLRLAKKLAHREMSLLKLWNKYA